METAMSYLGARLLDVAAEIELVVTQLCTAQSPIHFGCCIFKVPEVMRRQKKEEFDPHTVSIGPFHRGGEKFQLVEKVKWWYLKCLLSRKTTMKLITMVGSIQGLEKEARASYSDPCNHLGQKDFLEMLVLDGCFLIELFRKAGDQHRQDKEDPIFNVSCMLDYLYHDLLLLENQLPWVVLEFLYYDIIENGNPNPEPLSKLVIDFFKSVGNPGILSYPESRPTRKILHVVDLIRTSLVLGYRDERTDPEAPKISDQLPQRIPSAATLSEFGVKFASKSEAGCLLNITFKDGVFTIPPLTVDEKTSTLFRNLIAFEQCYPSCGHKITSYAVLMDNLIDMAKDVDLLCNKGIVVAKWLSADDASKCFNDLYDNTRVIGFVYTGLYRAVQEYLDVHRMRITWIGWKNKLRRNYFDTPWSAISFFAAFVLLVLTFLQTIYTIQQYYHPSS